jgi:predicted aldo/keto reductase-like oxidoreductase
MDTVRFGRTDLKISKVGFGGIPISPLPKNESVSLIKYCFDLGITFFDTANTYSTCEEKIGTALKAVREKVVIATKTMQRVAKEATAHIDLSLQQLKTDWIDIYQLHNISNSDTLQQVLASKGAYEAVSKAREAGKIRFIGISSHNIQIAMEALKTGLFQTLQFPFNFIENDPANELFPFARQNDVGIIAMKPLGGGLLERADLCFRFLQQHPYVVPIPGIRAKKEADEIVGLYRNPKPLSEADLKDMENIRAALGERFCHRCEYCMPCEQGVQIPQILIFQAAKKKLPRDRVTAWLGKPMESVAECIECGECEEKCPYDLPIRDLLKENLALFRKYE